MQLKTFYIKTFGCQMNYADSEKINMILISAWLRKVIDPVKADIVIMNTCSVRQKGEDKVFGFMREIERYHKNAWSNHHTLFGITGCMVRKSGIARKYLKNEEWDMKEWVEKRKNAEKIILLESTDSLMNYDDELFLRSQSIDFTFRIEEVSFVTKILSLISGEDIGNDAKWNEYLQVKQLQENPSSANIIIQTGCDNFCTFCIVPHTRGRELSRSQDEIIWEIQEVVKNGTKEVTLLGQNVNSYGKETKGKLWNSDELSWDKSLLLKGGADGGGGGFSGLRASFWKEVPTEEVEDFHNFPIRRSSEERINYREDLVEKAKKLRKNMTWPEKKIWYEILSGDKLWGFRFLRQKPLLDYIVDFYCDELKLVIEVDGESHLWNEIYDDERTQRLSDFHITVLRFTNDEALQNIEWVYQKIHDQIQILRPSGTSFTKEVFQTPFRELLDQIDGIDWLDRVRFTSSNPHDMTKDILDAHFDLPSLCPYLHFALQSGSDTMLKRMNRKHTYADFKAQVDYLRSRDPLFSISTDIIVGFPGETEEEFQMTATAMRECQFDFAFIARYNPRSGTVASTKYEDDISAEEKARQWTILNDILRETVRTRNLMMVGREEEILISGEGKDETWVGRTRNWKEVFIEKSLDIKVWDLVKVKILQGDGWVLKGERL
jgi:tRNA A37 methylthiotransferase MiaB